MKKTQRIYMIAALASLLLSFWISQRETVINPDAICYLQSAATVHEGLHAAMQLCGQAEWPFYSVLIAGLVKVSHFSYVTAAYVLDALFSLLTVLIFIRIVDFLNQGQKKTLLLGLAAVVILLAHQFNAVKTNIIRDHGFWAFYLMSLLFLLHYFRTRRWYHAGGWSVSIIIATLFRIEGAVFLLFVPWVSFATQQAFMSRAKSFITLNALTLGVGVLLCGWFIFHPGHSTGRLTELEFQLIHGVSAVVENFQAKSVALAAAILGPYSVNDAAIVLFFTLVSWYVFSVVANLSLIYSVLIVYAWFKRIFPSHPVVWIYIIINGVVTSAFLFEHLFLAKRYLIALSLVFMLGVPFVLAYLAEQWPRHKWPLVFAVFFILITALGGIFNFGYSKQYMRDAGQWLATQVPQNAALYSNDMQVMYYSQHFGNQIFNKAHEFTKTDAIAGENWRRYRYLAVRMDRKDLKKMTDMMQHTGLVLVKVFANKRGDQVRIYTTED